MTAFKTSINIYPIHIDNRDEIEIQNNVSISSVQIINISEILVRQTYAEQLMIATLLRSQAYQSLMLNLALANSSYIRNHYDDNDPIDDFIIS